MDINMNNAINSATEFLSNFAETRESATAPSSFKLAYDQVAALLAAGVGSSEPAPTEKRKPGRPKSGVDPEAVLAENAEAVQAVLDGLLTEKPTTAEVVFEAVRSLLPGVSLSQFRLVFGKALKTGVIVRCVGKLGRAGGYVKVA
jgi:hypothetical protein